VRKTGISAILIIGLLAGAGTVATAQDREDETPGLVTEMVEPGVERIISDGAGHDLDATHPTNRLDMDAIAIGPDGTVWLTTTYHGTDNTDNPDRGPFIWALGQPGTCSLPADRVRTIIALADGTLLVVAADERVLRFDGERFVPDEGSRWRLADGRVLLHLDAADLLDGSPQDELASIPDLFAVWGPGSGWTVLDELGRSDVPVADDRLCWVGTDLRDHQGDGVTCATIDSWSGEIDATTYLEGTSIGQLAAAPDGSVWAVGGHDRGPGGLYRIAPPPVE
jgi:hypothetical protein